MTPPPVVNVRPPAQELDGVVRPERSILVLGVDLGTTSGYCFRYHSTDTGLPVGPMYLGLWDLSAGPFDSGAIRFARLRRFLTLLQPAVLGYEDAKAQMSDLTGAKNPVVLFTALLSSQLFGAFKATVAAWAEEYDVPCQGFPVGTIKKRGTGKGNANKEDMVKAFLKDLKLDLDREVDGLDNVADAYYIYSLAVEQVLPGVLTKKEA